MNASNLLAIARETLIADILPTLTGDARFKALMVANAMAIAGREVQYGPVPEPTDAAALSAAIRAGQHDNDHDLAQSLRDLAEARCRISSKSAQK